MSLYSGRSTELARNLDPFDCRERAQRLRADYVSQLFKRAINAVGRRLHGQSRDIERRLQNI